MLFTVSATLADGDGKLGVIAVSFNQCVKDIKTFQNVKLHVKFENDDESVDSDITDEYSGEVEPREMGGFAQEKITAIASKKGYLVQTITANGSLLINEDGKQGVRNLFVDPLIVKGSKKASDAIAGFSASDYANIDDDDEREEAIYNFLVKAELIGENSRLSVEAGRIVARNLSNGIGAYAKSGDRADAKRHLDKAKSELDSFMKKAVAESAKIRSAEIVVGEDDTEETVTEQLKSKGVPEDTAREVAKKAIKGRPDDAGESMARVQKYADMIRDTREKYGDESAKKLARSTYQRTKDDALLTAEALVFGADKPKRKSVKNAGK